MKKAFLELLFSQIVRMRDKINKLPTKDKNQLRMVDVYLSKIMTEIEFIMKYE